VEVDGTAHYEIGFPYRYQSFSPKKSDLDPI
jgi:hypothetical protein